MTATRRLDEKLAAKAAQTPQLASNPEIEGKIAAYKTANPKYMAYLASLPRERLENLAVLRQIGIEEDRERYQTNMVQKVDKWLAQNPALAEKVAAVVSKLPEHRQASVKCQMVRNEISRLALNAGGPKV